jgi:hypothetical protein
MGYSKFYHEFLDFEEGCDFCCFNVTTYFEFELFNY